MKSDLQLQQDVLAELQWEPSVNAAHIGVEVKSGIVTLAGHVESYAEKRGAERATQRVAGVKALAVEMQVKLPGSSQRDDGDIAKAIEGALGWMSNSPKDSVRVMVEKGWVTLTGEVMWDYQRWTAESSVRYLAGVTGISNQITIRPQVSQDAVKSDIEAALERRAHDEAKRIVVTVNGGDVTLRGTAHTWAERDLARNTAWAAPGVRHVIDLVTIA